MQQKSGLSYWQGIWLGANELAKLGTYTWVSTGQPVGYNNWLGGQPDRNAGVQHCAVMISGEPGKWDDQCCYQDNYNMAMCEMILT